MVEHQCVANPPSDHVIGAGSIAADAHSPDFHAVRLVEPQTAAKHVNTAGAASNQRIISSAEQARVSFVSNSRIDRVTVLQSIETTAGLHGRVQIGRRQREGPFSSVLTNIEIVCSVGLLRGNYPATEPLAG